MQDHVHTQRNSGSKHLFRSATLFLERLASADAVRSAGVCGLDAQLHAVEAARSERTCSLAGKSDSARNEIRIELELASALYEFLKVSPDERLAAREVQLDSSERV